VLHELGHYLMGWALGLPHLAIHSSSVTFGDSDMLLSALHDGRRTTAAAIVPLGRAAATALAGPSISLVILISCAGLALRHSRAWVTALGAAVAWRFAAPVAVTGVLLLRTFANNTTPLAANVDEYNAALELGIQPLLLLLPEAALVFASITGLCLGLRRDGTPNQWIPLLVGLTISAAAYGNVLGPWLLP